MVSTHITDHLLSSELIPTLLKAQTSPDSSLATRMTLRDCTLFVQIPRELLSTSSSCPPSGSCNGNSTHGSRSIKVVIADLDEKSEEARGEYWRSLEESLIAGGYYLGEGKLDTNAEDCDLTDDVAWLTSQQERENGSADN